MASTNFPNRNDGIPGPGLQTFLAQGAAFFVGLSGGPASCFPAMSEHVSESEPLGSATHEEILAALFADLVLRQVNMARLFLGQAPHPETGQPKVDLEAAEMFIDQLEALQVRTRGNLTPPEEQLLKQSLTNLRLLFVQVSAHPPAAAPKAEAAAPPAPPAQPQGSAPDPAPKSPPEPEDPKVRFSKKY